MSQRIKRDKESRQKTFALAVLLVLLVGLAGIICARFNQTSKSPSDKLGDNSAASSGIVYDDGAVEGGWDVMTEEEIAAALNEKVQEGYINISMNGAPVFPNGETEGNLMIVNETVNRYPQRVEITRSDTGEVIYASGAIPVGSKIAADTLDVALDAGTYPCTAMFYSLDPDTGAVLGAAGANITITIQN